MENNKVRIGVIGAGIQGVCNSLFLQKKGFQVTLFDRDEPGNSASYGNAGHFSPYASVPLNRPDVLTDVPAMLLSSRGPLALKWNYVPKMFPWFLKFIMNCTTKNMMHTAKNMRSALNKGERRYSFSKSATVQSRPPACSPEKAAFLTSTKPPSSPDSKDLRL